LFGIENALDLAVNIRIIIMPILIETLHKSHQAILGLECRQIYVKQASGY